MRPGGILVTLLRYELLQVMRDRRTLLIAVVAPLLLFPLLILLARWSEERQDRAMETAIYEYAVTGSAAGWGRPVVRSAAALSPDGSGGGQQLEERTFQDPDSALREGALDLVVDIRASDTLPVPEIVLRYRTDSDFSRAASQAMEGRLRRIRERQQEEAFARSGVSVSLQELGSTELRNVATAQEEGGAFLGIFLTPFLVLLMLGGGAVAAADAISGEKERGTLETLLSTAATRRHIVGAKLLAIVAVGVLVTLVNVLNLLVYVVLGAIPLPERFAVGVPPGTLALLVLLYAPIALLVASVLLLLSGYAKSYKEYQIYAIPTTFLLVVPALAAALPGMDLRSAVAAVPLAGVSVGVREVLTGEYDWLFLAFAFASTSAAAGWAARGTAAFLSRERLITHAELAEADLVGGELLFRRHVLRWFGVLWVALLVSNLWLFGNLGLRAQVALNMLGLFLGGSLVMLRRYRLAPRRALALRWPPWASWLAVLVGVPSAQLTGVAVSRAAELVFPVPDRVVEAFGQYLLPEGMPLWQVLFFLCLLPGVCEEIAFRGVLLYGLRRSLPPARLCLIVGLVFGLFHVDLFRVVPTAYLGVILTAVVLLTGSILPAMAWHALNNALALVTARLGASPEEASPSLIALGVAGLCVSGWILWRTRRPYPDLRLEGDGAKAG